MGKLRPPRGWGSPREACQGCWLQDPDAPWRRRAPHLPSCLPAPPPQPERPPPPQEEQAGEEVALAARLGWVAGAGVTGLGSPWSSGLGGRFQRCDRGPTQRLTGWRSLRPTLPREGRVPRGWAAPACWAPWSWGGEFQGSRKGGASCQLLPGGLGDTPGLIVGLGVGDRWLPRPLSTVGRPSSSSRHPLTSALQLWAGGAGPGLPGSQGSAVSLGRVEGALPWALS